MMATKTGKFLATAALTCALGVGLYEVIKPSVGHSNPNLAELKLPGYASQKVVYHILDSGGSSDARYKGILGSIRNHLNAVGPKNIDLRVVLQSDGVDMLRDAKTNASLAAMVDGLKKDGVKFFICRNTLISRNIDPTTDLYDVKTNDLVAAGVAEVTSLQMQGFAYLRL